MRGPFRMCESCGVWLAAPLRVAPAIDKYVCIGVPDHDRFARVIYDRQLQKAQRLAIIATNISGLRAQLIDFIAGSVTGTNNSLDIIADAPGGIQHMISAVLWAIVKDDNTQQDERLIEAIRSKFVQCRLLGCNTGLAPVRKTTRDLAGRIGLPMIATLRGIAYTDFDDESFRDTQGNGETIVTTIVPTSHADDDDAMRSFFVQQNWLNSDVFERVVLKDGELSPITDSAVGASWIWRLSQEVTALELAATDVIETQTLDKVALKAPSGKLYRADVLMSGTLLRLNVPNRRPLYLNVSPDSPERHKWLAAMQLQLV